MAPVNKDGTPPAAPRHRLHHPLIVPAPGSAADDQVDPRDLKNPLVSDFLLGKMPGRLKLENGHWVPAAPEPPSPAPPQVATANEVVDLVLGLLRDGLLKTPETLPDALDQLLNLVLVVNEIDPTQVRTSLPYNSGQVRAGGFSVLGTSEDEAARPLKVDYPALGRELAQEERIRRLRAVIDPVHDTLEFNETHVLSHVFDHVDGGLKLGLSVIQNNAALARQLGPALAIKGKPTETGLATRGQNQRLVEATRADAQTQPETPGAEEPRPPTTTTTVTTQPAVSPPAGAPAPKARPGHGKKPG